MHHGRALRALRAYSILGKLFADFPASFVFVLEISACVRVRMRMQALCKLCRNANCWF